MERVKYIEKVFGCFSFDEAALTVVHVYGEEGKARFPLIVEPAASDYGLGCLVAAEPVHDEQKYISPPAVVRIQENGHCQKSGHAENLHGLVFPEIFDGAERQVTQKKSEKHVLFLETPGIGEHEVPRYLGDAGEDKQVQAVFPAVSCVNKSFHEQKAEDGEGHTANVTTDTVHGYDVITQGEEGDFCRGVIVQ